MVVDVITHGEVQCCAFCQGSVAQEVTVIFGAIEAYFAYIAVQPFTFLAAFPAAISAAITAVTVRSSAVEPVHHLSDVQNHANRAKNARILALGRSTDTSHARDIEVSRMITFPRRNFNALIINDLYFAR